MRIRVIILTIFGFLFLTLGFIGVFLPILPTTPFVLLGAACLSGTPKLRARVLQVSFFREYLESYQKGSGLPRKTVIKSLISLWGMLILTMVLTKQLWLSLLLILIGGCVTLHILWIAKPKGERKK